MELDKRSVVAGTLLGIGITGGGIVVLKWWRRQEAKSNPYETKTLIDQYLAFHYCPDDEYITYTLAPKEALGFPKRCAELCRRHFNGSIPSRALDIGCAVGRSTFELATIFEETIGIDFSNAFIDCANQLKKKGELSYKMQVEGDINKDMVATVDLAVDRTRVSFQVGDACNLPTNIGKFGMVLAANLICRLPEPMKFFARLKDLVVSGGVVVIMSPYSWLDEYTPKRNWIAGYYDAQGSAVTGKDVLGEIMSPFFDLVEQTDMPFLIRETIRKHQWTVAHATVWRRNDS